MKKILLLLLLFMVTFTTAQENEKKEKKNSEKVDQKPPIYPGCRGNNQRLTKCFNKKFSKFFVKNFNDDVVKDLNSSIHNFRVLIVLRIDKSGRVIESEIDVPHVQVKQEIEKVVEKLPRFKPATVDGKPVKVKYSVPVTIKIE